MKLIYGANAGRGECWVTLFAARWHVLLSLHRRWRLRFPFRVPAKPCYRRAYFGPLEIEVRRSRSLT